MSVYTIRYKPTGIRWTNHRLPRTRHNHRLRYYRFSVVYPNTVNYFFTEVSQLLTIPVFRSRAGVAVLNLKLNMFGFGFRAGVTAPGEDTGLASELSNV